MTADQKKTLAVAVYAIIVCAIILALGGCIDICKIVPKVCPNPQPTPTPSPTPSPSPTPAPTPTPTPAPTPTPPPQTGCTLGTPPATEAFRAEIKVSRMGKSVEATPRAEFGRAYYCSDAINWPQACAEGRKFGPVAPDGHPSRIACETVFLGQGCPTFEMAECLGTGGQCPITFDPFYVIDGVNQNHPANVAAGCNGADWVKEDGHVVRGMFWKATAHGKGRYKACDATGTVCGVGPPIDQ